MQIKRKVNALSRNYEIAYSESDLYSDSEKEKAEKMILKLEADLENNREDQGFDGSPEGVNEYLKANNCEIADDQKWKIGDGSWC